MSHERYESPLTSRYAREEMSHLFSPQYKHATWRRLWVVLAEAEKSLGLKITKEQIEELSSHVETIDFDAVAAYEKRFSHDVMAHIHAYGDQCPLARPILHLGATSCYVTDNTDLIQMREGLVLLQSSLVTVIVQLSSFAERYAATECLGYTHLQPAQLTTVGKRACLWIQDFLLDLEELLYRQKHLKFLGAKGATGTQGSFLTLFNNDSEKVEALDQLIASKMGFSHLLRISGQTYTRKLDVAILNALAGIAISAHKCCTDLRLLAHFKEVTEPFEQEQIGSSAMPYKKNPILAERVCSLSRFVLSLSENPAYTAATQWLERSLDDSANRRIVIPEAFLAVDGILELLKKITSGLVVHTKNIDDNVAKEKPFLISEHLLMEAVKKGGDRQSLHEKLRRLSVETPKEKLVETLMQDPIFNTDTAPQLSGLAAHQVAEFLNMEVYPFINTCR